MGLISGFERGLQRGWIWVGRRAAVLRPTWFAALLVLLVTFALQHSQARDALGSLAEDGVFTGPGLWLPVSVLGLAVAGWYFPRALLYVRYRYTPEDPDRCFARWRRWVPRCLGVLPITSLAVGFAREGATRYAVFYGVVGGVVLLGMAVRRRALRRFLRRLYTEEAAGRIDEPGDGMPRKTFWFLIFYLVASTVLIVFFLFLRVTVPQMVGPLGIIFISVAVLIAVGSVLLVYPANHRRLPSLVIIAVLAAGLFGRWNDNHEVRQGSGGEPRPRDPVADHLREWIAQRPEIAADPGAEPYPVFVVAAEGGGIRAAYWTALVLATLEDRHPGFACHVFAVSGVSGGSLGGAVFAALTAERWNESGAVHAHPCPPRAETRDMRAAVRGILGRDFLGPAVAGWLFPDFVQRFLPFPCLPDRAVYLEEAWEAAWRAETGTDRFARDFRELWADEGTRHHIPSLFLNGTWVETGGRVVTSNLRAGEGDRHFRRVDDMLDFLGRPLPLSTAVHMSARFTYVSPAGTVHGCGKDGKRETRHVVDGGYFENSGALTATEVVSVLDEGRRREGWNVRPVAIVIRNSPAQEPSWPSFLGETLLPLYTLLSTRTARGLHAEAALETAVSELLRFDLQQIEDFPLGWMLSDKARAEIEARIPEPVVARVGQLLRREGP